MSRTSLGRGKEAAFDSELSHMGEKEVVGIVGGSGYIGSSLAMHLAKTFEVKIVDVRKPPDHLSGKVKHVVCDIRKGDEVKDALSDVAAVIQTAIVQIPLINEQRRLGYAVNFLGTQNVCRVVDENPAIRGMILSGSWHTIGERGLTGVIDEEFGFRPDKVEDRARLYALSKMAQESVVRMYDEMSDKIFGIIRMGTVLGEGMPEKTAAQIFITRALKREAITPYRHSMYRPMLYVDIDDVCAAFERFCVKMLGGDIKKGINSLAHIVNVYYPEPVSILQLAEMVAKSIAKITQNRIRPQIEIIDSGQQPLFDEHDRERIKGDVKKAAGLLGLTQFRSPEESIERIATNRIAGTR
jgi:nucleoside-diphosphate-sugar epimerase